MTVTGGSIFGWLYSYVPDDLFQIGTDKPYIKFITNETYTRKTIEMICSYDNTLQMALIAGGNAGMVSWSMTLGGLHNGATLGYWMVSDTLYANVGFTPPLLWIDTGVQTGFEIEFECQRAGGVDSTITLNLYDSSDTTPLLTDTVKAVTAKGWENLQTNPTGIGNLAGFDQGISYVLAVSADSNRANIYHIRFIYITGIQNETP